MPAYNDKHPYEPDWQIPLGVWARHTPHYVWSLYLTRARKARSHPFDPAYIMLHTELKFALSSSQIQCSEDMRHLVSNYLNAEPPERRRLLPDRLG